MTARTGGRGVVGTPLPGGLRARRTRARLRWVTIAVAALLIAVGCGGEGARGPGSEDSPDIDDPRTPTSGASTLPEDPAAARDQWVQSAFLPSTTDPPDITDRFGPPDRRTAEPTPNRHVPDQTDSIVTLEYDRGLTVTFYAVTGGDALLQAADVSEPDILDDSPVDVGTAWPDVVELFGDPQDWRDGMPFYLCGSCIGAEEPVLFDVVDGVIRRIRFSYYVD